ncbi:MAG: hypothetical protein LBI40_02570 [Treponema sp.]|jgi:hypothetical protein|nr:hypothetical protein [Treponema sp.]
MKKKLIFSIMLVCVLVFVAVVAYAQNSPNVRWEYTTFDSADLNQAGIKTECNRLGLEGWEFVSATRDSNRSAPSIMVFKRRLP